MVISSTSHRYSALSKDLFDVEMELSISLWLWWLLVFSPCFFHFFSLIEVCFLNYDSFQEVELVETSERVTEIRHEPCWGMHVVSTWRENHMRQCHYSLLSPSAEAVGSGPPAEDFGQNPRHAVAAVGGLSQHILTLLLSGPTRVLIRADCVSPQNPQMNSKTFSPCEFQQKLFVCTHE